MEGNNVIAGLDDGLWTGERPFRLGGLLELGNRMTILRLRDGSLLVHSPNVLDEPAKAFFAEHGEPRYVIAPNAFHHLWLEDWRKSFPRALFLASPALATKRRDFPWNGIVGDDGAEPWQGEVGAHVFQGANTLGEVVLFHRASRTLILTDLLMNFDASWAPGFWSSVPFRIYGAYGGPVVTRLTRFCMKDRAAARASVEHLMAWEPRRVIVSHGRVLEDVSGVDIRRWFSFLWE